MNKSQVCIEIKRPSITMNHFNGKLYMKLTHKPTGMSVDNKEWSHEERSEHKTYNRLVKELDYKIFIKNLEDRVNKND